MFEWMTNVSYNHTLKVLLEEGALNAAVFFANYSFMFTFVAFFACGLFDGYARESAFGAAGDGLA